MGAEPHDSSLVATIDNCTSNVVNKCWGFDNCSSPSHTLNRSSLGSLVTRFTWFSPQKENVVIQQKLHIQIDCLRSWQYLIWTQFAYYELILPYVFWNLFY